MINFIRQVFCKMENLWYDSCGFLRNIWVFRKTLWVYRSYDYASYYQFLRDFTEDKIKNSSGVHVGWEKDVERMRVVNTLCTRLMEDSYLSEKFDTKLEFGPVDDRGFGEVTVKTTPLHDFPTNTKHFFQCDIEKQDFDMLNKIISKHLRKWWD